MKKDATAIGIIGIPDDNDIENLSKRMGKPIIKIEKSKKTILLIGKGLFKKKIVIPHSNIELRANLARSSILDYTVYRRPTNH